jgi:HAD superfamily hydrolase (TIGR01509 family)
MNNKIQPKAILFDMDGVLVDSLDSWWKSLNHSLKKHNQKEISRDEFIDKYWGHDLYWNLEKNNLDLSVGKFCNIIYYKYTDKVKIYKTTKKTLKKLSKYKKSIITNTPRDCTNQILENLNIRKYFDFILTSSDVKIAKPDPEIVLKACEKFKLNPSEVVLVGDTESDIKAGKKAGCKVIGVNIDADYRINELKDLLDILEI